MRSSLDPSRPPWGIWRAFCLFFYLFVASAFVVAAHADTPKKKVLILYSNQNAVRVMAVLDPAIREELQARLPNGVNIFAEYLDEERFPGPDQAAIVESYFRAKYADQPIDLIIALGPEALTFLSQRRVSLFSGAPLVFGGISEQTLGALALPAGATGVVARYDPQPTVDLALRLQPDAQNMIVITGASKFDRSWEDKARNALRAYDGRLNVKYLAALPMADLLRQVQDLPPRSLILYLSLFRDGAGQDFVPGDALEQIAKTANAPVYGVYDLQVGRGVVGGASDTFENLGVGVARLAARVLAGERPETVSMATLTNVVDWRQLQRWGLREADLPPDAVVRFKEATLWEKYWWQLAVAITLLVVQSLLLVALILQGARRKRAEQAVRENEERVTLAASSANLGLWQWDIVQNRLWVSDICRRILGLGAQPDAPLDSYLRALRPETFANQPLSFNASAAGGSLQKVERVLNWPDGSEHWIRAIGSTTLDASNKASRVTGAVIDITAEKTAEQESALWRQELTRLTRIATLGELSGALAHELNQPLTAILSNADAARHALAGNAGDIGEVREILSDIVADAKRGGEVIGHLRSLFSNAKLHIQPLALNDVVAEALKLVHSDLVARRVTLTPLFSPQISAVRGDRVQLQQVLLNLIYNACDAMAGNPPSERTLVVATAPDANALRVSVVDCGAGIEKDLLERLFKPFVTTKSRGLGLGLSICRSIVEAHGGRLWAFNNPDRGATFCFSLPAE
jgi:C4-dicarboxylate-specific signal transduction histidine kinase/ABC-type uncharacterized transport system substrate-binding protein